MDCCYLVLLNNIIFVKASKEANLSILESEFCWLIGSPDLFAKCFGGQGYWFFLFGDFDCSKVLKVFSFLFLLFLFFLKHVYVCISCICFCLCDVFL